MKSNIYNANGNVFHLGTSDALNWISFSCFHFISFDDCYSTSVVAGVKLVHFFCANNTCDEEIWKWILKVSFPFCDFDFNDVKL